MIIGTVGYMSPEQVRGAPVDHRSDIFSFGVILYEMLTGSKAFHGDSVVELMNAILKEDVPEFGDDDRRIPASFERYASVFGKETGAPLSFLTRSGFCPRAMSISSSSGSNRTEAVQMLDTMAMSKRSGWRDHIWMIVAVLLALALGAALWAPWRSAPRGAALRLTPFSFEQGGQSDAVWSPDGKAVAFAARQKSTDKYQSMCVMWIRRWRHRSLTSPRVQFPYSGPRPAGSFSGPRKLRQDSGRFPRWVANLNRCRLSTILVLLRYPVTARLWPGCTQATMEL